MPLYRDLRSRLRNGQWRYVVNELQQFADDDGDNAALQTELNYLRKHGAAGRLNYTHFRSLGLPLGSGAMWHSVREDLARVQPVGRGEGLPDLKHGLHVRLGVHQWHILLLFQPDTVFAGRCAAARKRALDQPLVKRVDVVPLRRVLAVDEDEAVEVPVADVADERSND